MIHLRRTIFVLAASLAFPAGAATPVDLEKVREHRQAAFAAFENEDFETAAAEFEWALSFNPNSLFTRHYLAIAYARADQNHMAMEALRVLVEARVDFGIESDQFDELGSTAEFRKLARTLKRRTKPVSNSKPRFRIDQLGLIPEGIAIDTATGRTFISSMRDGSIYVLDGSNHFSKFATVAHGGKLAAIGLCVDAARKTLWAVGAAFSTVENFDKDAPASTGVFGFSLADGNLIEKFIADEGTGGFNDVTVGPKGNIYLSGAVLSHVNWERKSIQPLITTPPLAGTNGIAATPDGKHLFVSSYPVGIAVIEIESGQAQFLDAPADAPLYGVDGLYWHEGDLIAVQNGMKPWRLTRVFLNDELTKASRVRLIEFANPHVEPTTGAIVDQTIHYVGTGPAPTEHLPHFPKDLAEYLGPTILMTAPLGK